MTNKHETIITTTVSTFANLIIVNLPQISLKSL